MMTCINGADRKDSISGSSPVALFLYCRRAHISAHQSTFIQHTAAMYTQVFLLCLLALSVACVDDALNLDCPAQSVPEFTIDKLNAVELWTVVKRTTMQPGLGDYPCVSYLHFCDNTVVARRAFAENVNITSAVYNIVQRDGCICQTEMTEDGGSKDVLCYAALYYQDMEVAVLVVKGCNEKQEIVQWSSLLTAPSYLLRKACIARRGEDQCGGAWNYKRLYSEYDDILPKAGLKAEDFSYPSSGDYKCEL